MCKHLTPSVDRVMFIHSKSNVSQMKKIDYTNIEYNLYYYRVRIY